MVRNLRSNIAIGDPDLPGVLNAYAVALDADDVSITTLSTQIAALTQQVTGLVTPGTGGGGTGGGTTLLALTNLVARPGPAAGSIAISWTDPNTGDSDVLIQTRTSATSTADAGAWVSWPHAASTATSQVITALTNGGHYDIQAAAAKSGTSPGPFSAVATSWASSAVDAFTGSNGSALSSLWAVTLNSGTAVINSNSALITTPAGTYAVGPNAHVTGITAGKDFDMVVDIAPQSMATDEYFFFGWSTDGTVSGNGIENGYYLSLDPAGVWSISKGVSNVMTDLTPGAAWPGTGALRVRFAKVGANLSVWLWNPTGVQPVAPTATATDSTYVASTGLPAWGLSGGSGSAAVHVTLDNFAFAVGTAPTTGGTGGGGGGGAGTGSNASGIPIPDAVTGYTKVFATDFDVTNFPEGTMTGQAFPTGYLTGLTSMTSYDSPTNDTSNAGKYYSQNLSVHDNVLDVHCHYYNGSPSGAAFVLNAGAGPWSGMTYGRTSFAMYVPAGLTNYGIAGMLWAVSNDWNDGEVDFPEGGFDGTIHGYNHQVGGGGANETTLDTGIAFVGGWHVYTIEWDTTSVRFYLDGSLVQTSHSIPSKAMRPTIQIATTGTAPASSEDGHVLFDWAVVWTKP